MNTNTNAAPDLREKLIDLIAQHLSGTYHCTRVWEAWNVGTMSQDDFEDVGESDTPTELADAILAELSTAAQPHVQIPPENVHVDSNVSRNSEKVDTSAAPKEEADSVQQHGTDKRLFCDLKTDEEKSNFFLSGRGYETGVIAVAIQNDVAMAYHRCAEYKKELAQLRAQPERVPLTDAEIETVIDNSTRMHRHHLGLVRGQMFSAADSAEFWVVKATEAAHGITEKKEQG